MGQGTRQRGDEKKVRAVPTSRQSFIAVSSMTKSVRNVPRYGMVPCMTPWKGRWRSSHSFIHISTPLQEAQGSAPLLAFPTTLRSRRG